MMETKRYKLIACGVFETEFAHLAADFPAKLPAHVELETVWLEQGLHRTPERLQALITDILRETDERDEPLDAVLLAYGICSCGTIGLSSERHRIVIPRAHDCITLFLGSKERYLDEFSRTPGTYWFTPGFLGGGVQPGVSGKYSGIFQEYEEAYETYAARFGSEDLARYIVESQEQGWIGRYTRGAYVESGLPGGEAVRGKAASYCSARDWQFDEVPGDLSLLVDLIAGNWDDERFLVVEPGEVIALGGVEDVVMVSGANKDDTSVPAEETSTSWVFDGAYRECPDGACSDGSGDAFTPTVDVTVGIDAGGTFTDAAVVSLADGCVLADAKAPTTHHDLSIGIGQALGRLPADMVARASRLSVSTTLATNTIVEGTGPPVGILLIGYDSHAESAIRLAQGDIKHVVDGCHDVYGVELIPLDETDIVETVDRWCSAGIGAVALSSYLAPRNPDHELRARHIIEEQCKIPVICGHELTTDLDSIRRAHTTILNARLIPVVTRLIDSVQCVVRAVGFSGDVRFVTTDGTLMNATEARAHPVRLVMSGPAASVAGARFLATLDSCVVVDMGGTTTDIAVVENGAARRSGRGAVVGGYATSVEAVDMRTIGLGGDSAIMWERGNLSVGPRRILPLCVTAVDYPEIMENLEGLRDYDGHGYSLVQPGIHYMKARSSHHGIDLTDRERLILDALADRPLPLTVLAERVGCRYCSLLGIERLERQGVVMRCGLTPTDLLAAEDRCPVGDPLAARLALDLYAARAEMTVEIFTQRAWREIHRIASSAVITEVVGDDIDGGSFPQCRYCNALLDGDSMLEVACSLKYPLVAVGAPTAAVMRDVGRYLRADVRAPQWGHVAGAVGAAVGSGGCALDMAVVPDGGGKYILCTPSGRESFRSLFIARHRGLEVAKDYAREYAARMGYDRFGLDVSIKDRRAPTAWESEVYIDTAILAVMRF